MSSITITMRLFGAFRKYGERIEFSVAGGSSVSTIKVALAGVLDETVGGLIADSAIANDEEILPGDYVIDDNAGLSILPPVCGG